MKHLIPINALGGNVSPTITAHYHKIGWSNILPHERNHIPEIAILEIEMKEPKPMQVAQIYDQEQNPMNGRVYSQNGIAPTLRTPSGGLSEPKIMQIGSYSPSSACNAKVLDADGICPTLLDHKGMEPAILTPIRTEEQRQLRKQGIDPFGGRQMLPRTDGVCNTITTVQKDNLLQEPFVIDSMQANAMRGSLDGASPCLTEAMGMGGGQIPMVTVPSILGYTRDDKGNVQNYHEREVAGTIHTSSGSGSNTDQFVKEPCGCYDNQFGEFAREPIEGLARTLKSDHHNAVMLKYRIRKLTPTECFRLMGVEDADIDKLKSAKLTQTLNSGKVKEKPMPKTALYKMAGNSIVVDVLYHIFKAMLIDEPPRQSKQLTIFDI